MPRRSYDQFCAVARALDVVGERWTLLIVRELLAGPRRYTDLHADLPGVSTDVLASRLKEMERDGLVEHRRLPRPAGAGVYDLTPRGRGLLPALTALAQWESAVLEERRPTDALRAHWFALPLLEIIAGHSAHARGVVEISLDEGIFHLRVGDADEAGYADGPAEAPDARIATDLATVTALASGQLDFGQAVADKRADVSGAGDLAHTLRTATPDDNSAPARP
ncbi:winged helix-turn-helix transcriptional regulator [Salinactinospora qingdaonensis]|uniref:Helix-turn-helix domain-containing protein n=1 Tax=Salinactinospora qingdaonensis TaxID=702744 RepID=A0ABP7GAX4_9ACTN